MSRDRLRVVVATPLSESLCRMIEEREPRIEMVRDQTLLPPMRHPADFSGNPGYRRSSAEQREFEGMLATADVLYGIPDVDPAALRRTVQTNRGLRWVHVMAAGGGSQVKAARLTRDELARVMFTTSAGVHGRPLAEFALFGLLAGAKTLPRLTALQGRHEWAGRWEMSLLAEQTVLILGLGGIGREVARCLKAVGGRAIGMSRTHRESVPGVDRVVDPGSLLEVVGEVDAVVVALPGTESTTGLLGDAFFAAARPGLTVVNVGRGTVIDEAALIDALRSGRVGFAALDVVAQEPLAPDSAFWDLPNVLISPHTAGLHADEDRLIAELFAENATNLLEGRPMRNLVDTVEFY